jgi:hypothetical protein
MAVAVRRRMQVVEVDSVRWGEMTVQNGRGVSRYVFS